MKFLLPLAVASAVVVPAPVLAQQTVWPLGESVKSPSKALSVPTKLDPVSQSLTDMLNSGGRIVDSHLGATGPVVTLTWRKRNVLCILQGANPATDQNVATSECYALN